MSVKTLADPKTGVPHPALLQQRGWTRPIVFVLVIFVLCAWRLNLWYYDRNAILISNEVRFPVYTDWDDVPKSEKLLWVRCSLPGMLPSGPGYLCARFTVPMDHQRPLDDSPANLKVHIAMVLLPAPGNGLETGRFSESPLILNPGGPGGSGTAFVFPPVGPAIQATVGGSMDIIGFDPRGIGATLPAADCFVDAKPGTEPSIDARNLAYLHRLTWLAMSHDAGLPNATNGAMDILALRAKALSKLCFQKDGNEGGFRYMGTPNVAADMKSIIDAHDGWIEENGFITVPLGAVLRSPSEAAPPTTKGKLVYWGFSYGTLLGQTFAAMYPDSVGRLILDGVVDLATYDRPAWISSSRDSDAILEKFFYFCHLSKDKCALFRQGDKGTNDIKKRYEEVMGKLRGKPLTTISSISRMPVVVFEADVKKVVFASLYGPTTFFPVVASLVNFLYTQSDLSGWIVAPELGFVCVSNFKLLNYPAEGSSAIGCSDQQYKHNATLDEVYHQVSKYTSFADVWTSIMLGCEGWGIEAEFPSPDWDAKLRGPDPINTSFPVLFASNTYDPATPLAAAVKMSRKFVDAGLFEVESAGHTTLASVSLCAIGKIRDYLQKGIIPPPPAAAAADGSSSGWYKCPSDERPWEPFEGDGAMHADMDLRVLRAMRDAHVEIIKHLTPPKKLRLYGN